MYLKEKNQWNEFCILRDLSHTAFPLKTLYLWHSARPWWHCLEGSHTHQTSPICCPLLDRRSRLYSLRRKQTYCCVNHSSSGCATREQLASPGLFLRSSSSASVRWTYGWTMDQSFRCHVRVGRTLRGNSSEVFVTRSQNCPQKRSSTSSTL